MKKKYIIGGVLVVILIIGFVFAKDYVSLNKKSLKRDYDTEFEQGSNIKTEELSEGQVESLYKLCKVWGYAKYHHPDVISGEVNWDAELFRVMPDVLNAANATDVNRVLLDWLNRFPVKPEQSELTEESEKWVQFQKESGKKVLDTSWIRDVDFLDEGLSEYLGSLSELYISDRENAYASFDKIGTVSFENEKMYDVSDGDMGMYLLGLFRFWNIYEYYSPNVEITTEDWNIVLRNAIPSVAGARDYRGYAKAIAEVVAKTGDAHSLVVDKELFLYYYYGKYFLPCDIRIIDEKVVVTQARKSEKQLQPGDVLLEIDGMSLQDRIEEQRKYHALPEQNKMLIQIKHLLLETKEEKAEV